MIKNCWQFVSCSSIYFFVILSKLNIFAFFYIVTFNIFFFIYRLFACSRCICFYWIDWLYSFIIVSTQYNAILLTSLNTLSFALLDLCFDFNFILFFIIFCDFSKTICIKFIFFLVVLFHFQVELLLRKVYNLQI